MNLSQVAAYIHGGNRLATLVGLTSVVDEQVGKDVAMQVAAMNPIALDKESVTQAIPQWTMKLMWPKT